MEPYNVGLRQAENTNNEGHRQAVPSGDLRHPVLRMELLEAHLALDSTVVLNEIMYNPRRARRTPRWNGSNCTTNWPPTWTSPWILEGGVDYKFPDKTIVPGKGYLVVAADPAAFTAATGVHAVGPFAGQLDNAGEELRLFNNGERLMNRVPYGGWRLADGSRRVRATLAERDDQTASDVPIDWTFSPEIGGTPGAANFLLPGEFTFETVLAQGPPRGRCAAGRLGR